MRNTYKDLYDINGFRFRRYRAVTLLGKNNDYVMSWQIGKRITITLLFIEGAACVYML